MQLAYQGETHYEIVRGDPKEFQDGITFAMSNYLSDASHLFNLYIYAVTFSEYLDTIFK